MQKIPTSSWCSANRGNCLAALALALAGCAGEPCDTPWYADQDGDGYGDRDVVTLACGRPDAHVENATDCDDTSAAVHPAAGDVCNGRDDNCDGVVDPEVVTWYADDDGDGWGDAERAVLQCTPLDGYVGRAGDCDDRDPSAYPENPVELCDGIDQDCDGLVDEGASGTIASYPDVDGDGFGDPAGEELRCSPPAGWVTNGDDCADDDPLRNPRELEVCNGLDDDCDLLPDMADPEGTFGTLFVFTDADGDGFGAGDVRLDCLVGAGEAPVAGDCDDGAAEVNPDAAEVCNGGVDDDCDLLVDDGDPSIDLAGTVPVWPDADGDGYGDPSVRFDSCGLALGYVLNDLDCDDSTALVGPDLWVPDGDGDGAGAGVPELGTLCAPPAEGYVNLALAGDCDDGDPAFRPGAPDACEDGVDHDCSTVDPACGAPFAGIESLEDRGRAWADGNEIGAEFGAVGAGGDLDGDGVPDVAVGAPNAGGVGEVQIFRGPPPEQVQAWWPSRVVTAPEEGRFGATVTLAAGEGGADHLFVGAPTYNGTSGRLYVYADGSETVTTEISGAGGLGTAVAVVSGGAAPLVAVGSPGLAIVGVLEVDLSDDIQPASTADLVLRGESGSAFGSSVAATADGSWIAVGDPIGDTVSVFNPREAGDFTAEDVVITSFTAVAVGDALGAAVAAGGDFDGDGTLDFAGSAPGNDVAAAEAGAVYVWSLGATGDAAAAATLEVRGDGVDAQVGQSVALADLDGDGQVELVFGGAEVDVGGTDSGAVYVFGGGASGVWDALSADAVWYGPAGGRAGASLVAAEIDPDPGSDLWIGVPGSIYGAAWYVAGPVP